MLGNRADADGDKQVLGSGLRGAVVAVTELARGARDLPAPERARLIAEIGRASWRERV